MRSYRASEALWRDVLGTNKSGSLSCVFNSRNIADTWWVIKHKPSLTESSRGLIFVLPSPQINLQTTLLEQPSTQYLLMARSPDCMHCVYKGKYICWFCSICTLTTSLSAPPPPRCIKSLYRFPPQYCDGVGCWLTHLWVETSLDVSWEKRRFVGWTLSGAHTKGQSYFC